MTAKTEKLEQELTRSILYCFLNKIFLETTDSSKPVFEAITENLQQMMRLTNHSSPTDDIADGGDIEVDHTKCNELKQHLEECIIMKHTEVKFIRYSFSFFVFQDKTTSHKIKLHSSYFLIRLSSLIPISVSVSFLLHK